MPDNAKYFRINNGIHKGLTDNEDTQLRERYSEVKEIANNGLYKFVDDAYLTSIGESPTDPTKYIQGSTVPTSEATRHNPNYLLELVNPLVSDEEIVPIRIEEIKLAEIVTDETEGANKGKVKYIKWLKPEPGHADDLPTVDAEYLANQPRDIGETAGVTKVKVIKKGTYYWKELTPPEGYKLNEDLYEFVYDEDGKVYFRNAEGYLEEVASGNATVTIENEPEDEPQGGDVVLTKTAKEATRQGTADAVDVGESLGAGYGFLLYHADGTLVQGVYKRSGEDAVYYVATVGSGTAYNTESCRLTFLHQDDSR